MLCDSQWHINFELFAKMGTNQFVSQASLTKNTIDLIAVHYDSVVGPAL
jgi:hypothetical protein